MWEREPARPSPTSGDAQPGSFPGTKKAAVVEWMVFWVSQLKQEGDPRGEICRRKADTNSVSFDSVRYRVSYSQIQKNKPVFPGMQCGRQIFRARVLLVVRVVFLLPSQRAVCQPMFLTSHSRCDAACLTNPLLRLPSPLLGRIEILLLPNSGRSR